MSFGRKEIANLAAGEGAPRDHTHGKHGTYSGSYYPRHEHSREKATHMARHIGWALAICVLLGSAGTASASHCTSAQADQQKPQQNSDKKPPVWIWWKDESAKSDLKLTADQIAEIDKNFQSYLTKAKPLREEVMALEGTLNRTIRENTADVSVVSSLVEKVEGKRAELNKMRVVMLYRIRHVLTPEQNTKFNARVDRWEAARKKAAGGGHSK
jgi:Spy/CpxP family protein refolding chaperone